MQWAQKFHCKRELFSTHHGCKKQKPHHFYTFPARRCPSWFLIKKIHIGDFAEKLHITFSKWTPHYGCWCVSNSNGSCKFVLFFSCVTNFNCLCKFVSVFKTSCCRLAPSWPFQLILICPVFREWNKGASFNEVAKWQSQRQSHGRPNNLKKIKRTWESLIVVWSGELFTGTI